MRIHSAFRVLCVTLLLSTAPLSFAQRRHESLTDREIELVRENALDPVKRVGVFQNILDDRIDHIQALNGKKYEAGKVDDLHDLMEQVADIAGELEENLETYNHDHSDVRKALPKLSVAAQRWMSVLNQTETNDRYELVRKFAIDAVTDIGTTAADLLPAQQKYFKEHPPAKNQKQEIVPER